MKRIFCLLLAASLVLLSGCFGPKEEGETSSEEPASTSSQPAEEPETQTPGVLPPLPQVHISVGNVVNVVEGSYVNVRSGPDKGSEAIGRAVSGEQYVVDAAGSTEEWVKIFYDGQNGYVYKDYISIAAIG